MHRISSFFLFLLSSSNWFITPCFSSYSLVHSLVFTLLLSRYRRGIRKTGLAIRKAISSFFRKPSRRRRNILIVMTSGKSRDSLYVPGVVLRRKKIEAYALGVGKKYDLKQLFQIATNRKYVFTAAFRTLGSIVRSFRTKICRRKYSPFLLLLLFFFLKSFV